jgi:Raf kinase inhibitor-like YbhB/YbcL family protein
MPNIAELFLRSATFTDNGRLPLSTVFHEWGYGGGNRSPHLAWSNAPARTRSFALECHDPDAPTGIGFTHWVLFDIPANISELPEGVEIGRRGLNDMGKPGYMGPAPPPGPAHHYIFTVYALAEQLDLGDTATLAMVRFSVRDKTLAQGRIMGIYGL